MDTRLGGLWPMLWQATGETLVMVGVALTLGGALGLLLGALLYGTRRGGLLSSPPLYTVLNLLVNFFRPIPFVILISALQPLARIVVGIGIGNRALIFTLTFAATFGIARIVEQNLVTVPLGVVEAARAMGAGRWQILFAVVVPEALGPLILGYTFGFVAIVDMSAIAGVIGGGGLGNFALTYGYRQYDTVVTWVTLLIIVAIVQVGQFIGNRLSRRALGQ